MTNVPPGLVIRPSGIKFHHYAKRRLTACLVHCCRHTILASGRRIEISSVKTHTRVHTRTYKLCANTRGVSASSWNPIRIVCAAKPRSPICQHWMGITGVKQQFWDNSSGPLSRRRNLLKPQRIEWVGLGSQTSSSSSSSFSSPEQRADRRRSDNVLMARWRGSGERAP